VESEDVIGLWMRALVFAVWGLGVCYQADLLINYISNLVTVYLGN
jgi:hypothetical protein